MEDDLKRQATGGPCTRMSEALACTSNNEGSRQPFWQTNRRLDQVWT